MLLSEIKLIESADARAAMDKMLNQQRAENKKDFLKPCSLEDAQKQHKFLVGWSKKKPIKKYGDDASTFWAVGKWMTKIPPGEVSGMVKHGLATLNTDEIKNGSVLTLVIADSGKKAPPKKMSPEEHIAQAKRNSDAIQGADLK